MKFSSSFKFLLVAFTAVFSCGAGYVGDLPKFIDSSNANQQQNIQKDLKEVPPPIMPLTPKEYPTMYQGAIIRQNKYSKYQKDLIPLMDKLENIKKTMLENSDMQMQLFCAQANLVDLYVATYLKEKYAKKPERFYESYKKIVVMDKNIVDTSNYWRTTRQYLRMIYKSQRERKKEEIIFKKKYNNTLKSINDVLEILKEDLRKD